MKLFFIITLIVFVFGGLKSQNMTISTTSTPAQLVSKLLGSGVTASNITYSGATASRGSFLSGYTIGFPIDSGIILTSGSCTNVPGWNTSGMTSYNNLENGDADLNTILGGDYTINRSVLEFDFVPVANKIQFNFIFASEEYPEFNCGTFNDIFAFLLTGPNPSGGNYNKKNLAVIPGTNTMVSVNSVNNGIAGSNGDPINCTNIDPSWQSYSVYYNDNPKNGSVIKITPDGYTDVFVASANVVPGQTYHIKLAIADASSMGTDADWDSYVFLESHSFVSPSMATSVTANNTSFCSGESTYIKASTTNGTAPYTYNWSNGVNHTSNNASDSILVNPSLTTTYHVTITDSYTPNHVSEDSIKITVNTLPTVSISASPATICNGNSSTLTATGASTYSWNYSLGTGNQKTVSPSSTTTYAVIGTDANSCTKTAIVVVTVNLLPAISVSASSNTICNGSSTTLTASGGNSYSWNDGLGTGNSEIVSPSSTTTYIVTGTDANSCTNTANITVNVNSLPGILVSASASTICSGQSSTITASGASLYVWDNSLGSTNPVSVSPLSSTTYNVTGTDANGCTNTNSLSVTVNQTQTTNAGTDQSIPFGTTTSLSGSASGGSGDYSYSWQPADSLVTADVSNPATQNLEATTLFTLITTDNATGCQSSNQVVITITGGPLTVLSNTVSQTICNGQSTTLNVLASGGSGVYSYSWASNPSGFSDNTSNPTVTPNASTMYYVTVNDGFNSSIDSLFVTVNSLPVVSAGTDISVCQGSTLTLNGSGTAITYLWNNGVNNGVPFMPSLTNIYTVTGTDANGCSGTDQVVVTVNSLPIVNANTDHSVICYGVPVILTGSGTAISYIWDNSAIDGGSFVPVATATYSVTGTDANGCTNTNQVVVTVNSLPTVNANADHSAICLGNSVTLTGIGTAVNYSWNNSVVDGLSFIPSSTITYIVTGTDANNCSDTARITVIVNPLPTVIANANQSNICQGNSVVLSGSGTATQFIWDNGAVDNVPFVPLSSYTYTVTGTDANSCSNTAQISINVNNVYLYNESYAICEGQTYSWHGNIYQNNGTYYDSLNTISGCDSVYKLVLQVNPAYSYADSLTICQGDAFQWHGVSYNTSGVYYDNYVTNTGCDSIYVLNLTVKQLPDVSITTNFSSLCEGGSATIVSGGALFYIWSTGDTTTSVNVSPQNTTTYTVTGTLNGCSSTASVTIPVHNTYSSTTVHSICEGESYNWNNDVYILSGIYTLNLSTIYGCDSTLTLNLEVNSNPSLIVTAIDTLILLSNSTTLTAAGADSYQWYPSAGLSCSDNCNITEASPAETTNYCVVGTNANGCSDTICLVITVDSDCGQVFIPLAFSPNGDGDNDVWKVQGRCLVLMDLKIFDRWGEKVFETNDPGASWDGTYKGKSLDTDVYVYMLKLTMRDGEVKNFKGDITLVR